MGCPDWPKCFGQYIPPTSAEQLPPNYLEQFEAKRQAKNERLASMLRNIGLDEQANNLLNADLAEEETQFNATKTWIEYINRLVGVAIGLLIIATFVYSIRLRTFNPKIPLYSLLAVILVIFQGWLGSIVVSSNLLPGMVTVHMLPALLLVALLIYAWALATRTEAPLAATKPVFKLFIGLSIVLTLVQIVLGTQVREGVDMLYWTGIDRKDWISALGNDFIIHRTFSWLVLAVHVIIFALAKKHGHQQLVKQSMIALGLVLVLAVSGISMAYFDFPAAMQPIHLLVGTALFGYLVYMALLLNRQLKLQNSLVAA